MTWSVFWDLKILHLTVNIGDGYRKAGKGNKAETIMQNDKMRRNSEFVQTGSTSRYTKYKGSLSAACDGGEFFLVVYLSIFILLDIHVCCFMAKKLYFFLLHFPLLNWSQFITKKKPPKTRTWITFFVKGFCANRNRHTDWKDARDGKQSSRKTNMAGVAARKVEPAEIKN